MRKEKPIEERKWVGGLSKTMKPLRSLLRKTVSEKDLLVVVTPTTKRRKSPRKDSERKDEREVYKTISSFKPFAVSFL